MAVYGCDDKHKLEVEAAHPSTRGRTALFLYLASIPHGEKSDVPSHHERVS